MKKPPEGGLGEAMDGFWIALARPLLYLVLYVCVVYWIAKFFWWLIPDGKIKRFLFKRRGL